MTISGDELIRVYKGKTMSRSQKVPPSVQYCSHLYPRGIFAAEMRTDTGTSLDDGEAKAAKAKAIDQPVKKETGKSLTEMVNMLCTVCYGRLRNAANSEEDEQVIQTDCNHFFHAKCLAKWTKMSKTCPVCRKQLNLPHHA